jgi:archaemetzincin
MKGQMAIALFFLLAMAGCTSHPGPSLQKKGIGIQPIAFDDSGRLEFIQHSIGEFFHCPVCILRPIEMPAAFINRTKGERYSAESVLHWLSQQKSDSTAILLGLTEKDIFIADKDARGKIKEPASKYAVWGILGLGYQPGVASVVSDARFRNTDQTKYNHRLRAIVIHEVGHNIGLPHCQTIHCIMNDANEHISTIDAGEDDLCQSCRNKLAQLLK